MARFYASIRGSRGLATRMGTPSSGIVGHVRGWNVGARIEVSDENGKDVVRVYRTGGSNGNGHSDELLAEFSDGGINATRARGGEAECDS